jgi:hypothetical protein
MVEEDSHLDVHSRGIPPACHLARNALVIDLIPSRLEFRFPPHRREVVLSHLLALAASKRKCRIACADPQAHPTPRVNKDICDEVLENQPSSATPQAGPNARCDYHQLPQRLQGQGAEQKCLHQQDRE